jgi:GT2 family glycosyltransferase
MPSTAIVILNWNGRRWLERFLPGVVSNSPGATIVVADNGSSDDSLEWLARAQPGVRTIELGTNLGFAGGYNAALRQLEADRFVLLNSDVEVAAGWLQGLTDCLDRNPDMAACQPKVLAHGKPSSFEHAGAAGGFIDRNGYPFCRGRIFELTEEDHGQYDDDCDVFWATGACLMVRADAFREVGGFDEHLFAHMEEIDLCWRLKRLSWRIGYTSASVVRHVGGGALGYGSPRKTYLNFRNSLIVLTKHLRSRALFLRIVRRLALDGFAALKFLVEGHSAHAWQVVRAHWHYFAALPRIRRQRIALSASERSPRLDGLYLRSIAYDRFILGWKTFSALDRTAFIRRAE